MSFSNILIYYRILNYENTSFKLFSMKRKLRKVIYADRKYLLSKEIKTMFPSSNDVYVFNI